VVACLMGRRAVDWIPDNILAAARQAGLGTPLWYVGRTKGQRHCRQKTLADLADEGRGEMSDTTVVEPPVFTEEMRGSSPGRHPWFLRLSTSGPPNIPPGTRRTSGRSEGPPDPDQCPSCRYLKVGICKCGYDWVNWCWVGEKRDLRSS
jgi:hypothetical protein